MKYLEELHSASYTFTARKISSLEDLIETDLLPALDLRICSFQRQESDQLRLTTSIKKHKPIFFTYDNTSRKDSEDIMKRFALKGNERQINVIFVRSDEDVRPEQDIKPKTGKPRRLKVHRVQQLIKKEVPEDPQADDP
ncbi:hypothetical protein ACMYSQ_012177 [Aspergillus niger]